MDYNLEIQKILLKVNATKDLHDKINLLKQAVTIADANNDVNWGVDLRLDIMHNEVDTPGCAESFPAFVWILNAYDNNPDLFDESDFLWEYKWMADESISNPGISLEQIDDILEDFRVRCNRNGYTDHAYYNLKIFRHMFLYEFDKAREYVELRNQAPRDRMSDHPAWELNSEVLILLKEGKFDDAVFKAQDILTRKLTSDGLPFATLSSMSYYLARGKDSRASEYGEKALSEIAGKELTSSFICNMAQIIYCLFMNGEKERAWKYFEDTAHWFIGADDFLSFDYIIFVLPLLKEKNERTLNISPRLPYYRTDNIYDTEELWNFYYPIAEDLAKRFDERNKNDVFGKRFEEHVNLNIN